MSDLISKKQLLSRLIAGDFRFTTHALLRMEQRFVSVTGIRSCARRWRSVLYQPVNDTWKVSGLDNFGEKLVVICTVQDGVLIVTVY
jgi:hypothetical protein